MTVILKPQIMPAGGLPTGVKEAGQRVDFKSDKFSLAIATKGYRMWWSRAGICPCRNNSQTDQPLTTCELCNGHGYFYFLPEIGLDKYTTDSYGNPIQLNSTKDAVMIQAIMTSANKDPQIFERFGEWIFGSIKITVEHANKFSYHDRLICVDALMAWSQLIKYDGNEIISVTGGYDQTGIRYPVVSVNLLRSTSQIFVENEDYYINDQGGITWIISSTERPDEDEILSLHYNFNPVFNVIEYVYAFRDTLVFHKNKTASLAEQVNKLPIHAIGKLDFLIDEQ